MRPLSPAGTLVFVLLLAAAGACRQAPPAPVPSPYAGAQDRPIKALSPDDVTRYLSGEGMGQAMAAELNHHPGPRHALELAERLGLTPDQQAQTRAVYDAMHAEAVRLGTEVVAGERRLDSLFAVAHLDDAQLHAALRTLALLQGELRYVHLRAHLQMKALLTPEQVQRYDHLRGYTDAGSAPAHAHPHTM